MWILAPIHVEIKLAHVPKGDLHSWHKQRLEQLDDGVHTPAARRAKVEPVQEVPDRPDHDRSLDQGKPRIARQQRPGDPLYFRGVRQGLSSMTMTVAFLAKYLSVRSTRGSFKAAPPVFNS